MKVIACRMRTPSQGRDSRATGGSLPTELLSGQINRLAIFCVVAAALWTFGLFIDRVLVPHTARAADAGRATPIEIAGMVVSVLVFAYTKFARHAPATKLNVGLGYMIFCTAGVAYINTQILASSVIASNQISWTALVILV